MGWRLGHRPGFVHDVESISDLSGALGHSAAQGAAPPQPDLPTSAVRRPGSTSRVRPSLRRPHVRAGWPARRIRRARDDGRRGRAADARLLKQNASSPAPLLQNLGVGVRFKVVPPLFDIVVFGVLIIVIVEVETEQVVGVA